MAGSNGRSGRLRSLKPLRYAGKKLGGAVTLILTGGRRRDLFGRRRRHTRPIATAYVPEAENGQLSLLGDQHGSREVINSHPSGDLAFPAHLSLNGRHQGLIAVGHKQWGNWWDGRGLLKVRIYDFALYADGDQVQQAVALAAPPHAAQQYGLRLRAGHGTQLTSRADLFSHVNRSHKVDMSLQLRAARNLPISQLAQEFDDVLQRRSEKVGGTRDDPALRELVQYFSHLRLPSAAIVGDAVRRGSVITFARSSDGELVTMADGVTLGKVQSPKLCEALFDLYLGDPPVCRQAKSAGESALVHMAAGLHHPPQPRLTGLSPAPLTIEAAAPSGQVAELVVSPVEVAPAAPRAPGPASWSVLQLAV